MSASGEREPLLGAASKTPSPTLSIAAVARSLAALRAGKLPSSSQLASTLRAALRSPLLEIEHTVFTPTYGTGRIGTGQLTREGERVRQALADVVGALLRLVVEKDPDDCMQKFSFACRQAQLDFQLPSTTVPSPSREGIDQAKSSLQTLVVLFVTSPQLRSLIHDAVYLARDLFDAAAEDTGQFGAVATAVVDRVADSIAPGVSGEPENVVRAEETPAETPTNHDNPAEPKSAEDLRDEFLDRFKEILLLIQANPAYQSAIRTLLSLLKTYLHEIVASVSLSASLKTPPKVESPLSLLVSVLEPFTGGPSSLSPLLATLSALAQYTHDANRISTLLSDLDSYISHALLEPGYLSSASAHRRATALHADLTQLADDNPAFREDVRAFVGEVQTALESMARDRALGNLLGAMEKLGGACETWAESAAKVAVGQQGVWGDVVEWAVPRLGSLLRELPLPRIEFASEDVDLAIEAPPFLSTSFIPDSIKFDTNTSLLISPFAPSHPNSFTSSSTLVLEGLRMSTENVGYFVRYKAFCIPFVESGLLDLHFGTTKDGGLGATIDFATSTTAAAARKSLFEVEASAITIESFDVRPHESSHPILMWFLRPLLRRVVRQQVEQLLEEQLRGALETVSRVGWEIRQRSTGENGWRGIVGAVLDIVVNGYEEGEPQEESDAVRAAAEEAEAAQAAATVHVSSKGVTIDLENAQVGVGEEGIVLPLGEAETPLPRPTVVEVVQEQTKEVVRDGARAADLLLDGVAQIGEAVGEFGDEVEQEREQSGWRSDAFDWEA